MASQEHPHPGLQNCAAIFGIVGVVFGIIFGIHSCVSEDAKEVSSTTVAVGSKDGWVRVPLRAEAGKEYKIRASGSWTVDYLNFPKVGPEGYGESTDAKIYQGCKIAQYPYAKLIGKFDNGPTFSVGSGGRFANEDGTSLFLRINDSERCFADNDGMLSVRVTI